MMNGKRQEKRLLSRHFPWKPTETRQSLAKIHLPECQLDNRQKKHRLYTKQNEIFGHRKL